MTSRKTLQPLLALLGLLLLLTGAGLLRPGLRSDCPRGLDAQRGEELIWETLSRHLLPQAAQ